MATIPYGLSISHLVSSAGADVGFAAILGLAILVLLFFSQARETANLRRRADEAEEQLRDLAAYVDQLLRRPAAQPSQAPATGNAAPVPPPAAARVAARQAAMPAASRAVPAEAAAASAVATVPSAPAGVAAPALSSATRLIPLTVPGDADPISIRALKNGHAEAGGDPEATEAAPGATATATAPVPAAPVGPPPSTAAANGSGRAATPAAAPAPARAPDGPAAREPQRREPAAAARPSGPPAFNDPVPPSRTRVSRMALAVASVVAVVVVIVAVVVLVNRGSGNGSAQNSAATSRTASTRGGAHSRHRSTTVKVVPSTVTVAVLNGTTTTGLAADVMSKLTAAGYKPGATTNAPEQNLTTTIVGYTQTGFRADALAVAKSLNVAAASVRAVSAADHTAACHGTTAGCTATVVVTLGANLASAAGTATTGTTP